MKILPAVATVVLLAVPAAAQDYGRSENAGPGSPAPAFEEARAPAGQAAGPAALHAALHLRPDQEDAWRALDAQTRPDPERQAEAWRDQDRTGRMSTPERLDFTQARMARDAADFARRADAIRRFYAQLTASQRGVFDRLTGPPTAEGRRPPPP